jgi:selT/selW/selH-like putative selenoprotein
VYKKHASALAEELQLSFAGAVVKVNPVKPRSKSFECTLVDPKGEEHVVWSGIKLGPPRKLKFPESGKVVELVKEKMADLGLDK